MANLNVTVVDGNNINVEVVPTPRQTITIDKGVAGVGIASAAFVEVEGEYFIEFTYTNGTTELVPFPDVLVGVSSFNTRVGEVTLTSGDVSGALGYTPVQPNGTGATGTWNISILGNAENVNGVVAIANGGTGAATDANARANLSAAILGVNNDITSMTGVTGGISSPDYIQFDVLGETTQAVGKLQWDDGNGTLQFGLQGGNVNLQVGQEILARVYNDSGAPLVDGQIVYISGAQGNRVAVKLAQANSEGNSAGTLGMVTESIATGAEGFITIMGTVNNLNTIGLVEGALVYLSATTAGAYTTTPPVAPNHRVTLGYVERVHATVGSIYVKVDNGYELDELHNVKITDPQSGQVLIYDAAQGVWENASLTAGTGISITNGAGSITVNNTGVTSVGGTGTVNGITLTGTVTSTGNLTLGGTLSGVSLTTQVSGTLPIANGGTNATTAADARTSLGLGTAAVLNAAVALGAATLDAGGTVPLTQIPASIQGGLNYQGTWNASTNTPTLTSSVGTKGHYYAVSVAGSTNLDGITDWNIGDLAVFDGLVWQQIDNTDAVTSVNGYTGSVVLTNTDISGFGTMSTQNATTVAITGGSINGTTVGATTASTGAFTDFSASGSASFTSTGAVKLPVGTAAERPTPAAGMLRFNDDSNEFEGYNGAAWSSVGGSAISNDTATATDVYPLFANATTGTAANVYTSNAKLLYKPSTGELKSEVLVAQNGLVVNSMTIDTSYTIPTGHSASSVGAITVNSGVSVTVPSGSRWVIL